MADLSTLSANEREVLMLLAEGHTAKSAAARLGVSENTINERLRSARVKARMTSSRELARLVRQATPATQKIRTEQIVVAPTASSKAERASRPVLTLRIAGREGTLIVTGSAIGLGALALYAISGATGAITGSVFEPHVVSTYPAENAKIPAGKLALRVTFSRPMRPGSYSFVALSPESYPKCLSTPEQSADGRSFTLECMVEPHRTYAISFNSKRFLNFVAADGGVAASPTTLHFTAR